MGEGRLSGQLGTGARVLRQQISNQGKQVSKNCLRRVRRRFPGPRGGGDATAGGRGRSVRRGALPPARDARSPAARAHE